ncbi:cAMP-responsive element-binding protein-like 2 isoform X1 [Molothrus aeneus]|uniref:cAMP-responsive element-binding protein-like 2 isoform X1 n=1 Tax=Molothrus aeneus TaxID=84833 RepID=UPI003458403B
MDDSKVVGGKVKKPGKRGRKPAKIDLKAKLERSRQSARECRARKKLRYQYLEELVSSRERAICALREELEMYKQWCMAMDQGKIPSEIKALLTGEEQGKAQQNSTKLAKAAKTEANSSNPCVFSFMFLRINKKTAFPTISIFPPVHHSQEGDAEPSALQQRWPGSWQEGECSSEEWMRPQVQGKGSQSVLFSLLLPT